MMLFFKVELLSPGVRNESFIRGFTWNMHGFRIEVGETQASRAVFQPDFLIYQLFHLGSRLIESHFLPGGGERGKGA